MDVNHYSVLPKKLHLHIVMKIPKTYPSVYYVSIVRRVLAGTFSSIPGLEEGNRLYWEEYAYSTCSRRRQLLCIATCLLLVVILLHVLGQNRP